MAKLGEKRIKRIRTQGGGIKLMVLQDEFANVTDPKTKKAEKTKIKRIVENKANPHYVRLGIITKGAVIETEKGLARVSSRPGKDGTINAILIEK